MPLGVLKIPRVYYNKKNMSRDEIPYELLAKYFSGECTELEKEKLFDWVNASPGNRAVFSEYKKLWSEPVEDYTFLQIPDKEKVWHSVSTATVSRQDKKFFTRVRIFKIMGLVALVALVIASSLSFIITGIDRSGYDQQTTMVVPPGQKSQIILPDGTTVWLNSDSKLVYPTVFNRKNRTVQLTGEGFFEVKKSKNIPFIVEAEGVDIRVHGTTFNVQAYPKENNVNVALLEGSVSIYSTKQKKLLTALNPGQTVLVERSDLSCLLQVCDKESEGIWRFNKLKFEDHTAQEVWKKIERWYGVNISLENMRPALTYWLTVKTESLTELLEVINKVTPVDYTINGEEVHIRYK